MAEEKRREEQEFSFVKEKIKSSPFTRIKLCAAQLCS